MLGVIRVVSNTHRDTSQLNSVQQFNQRKMRFQEIRFAAKFWITSILRFAGLMPRVITAPPSRKFDGVALPDESLSFGTIFIAFDDIFLMQNYGRMTRQANCGSLRTSHMNCKKDGMKRRHVNGLISSIRPRPA